jgi:hypothetical protein
MKFYEKMMMTPPTSETVPKLGMQIAEVPCYHCGRITRVPVKPEWVDWERVAEKYRQGYEKMMQRFGQIVTDVNVMHAGPNPVLEYIENEWKVLLDDLRKDLEA